MKKAKILIAALVVLIFSTIFLGGLTAKKSDPDTDARGSVVEPPIASNQSISATLYRELWEGSSDFNCLNQKKVLGEIKNGFSVLGKFGFKCVEEIKDWASVPMSRTSPNKRVAAKIHYDKLSDYTLERISKQERIDYSKLSDAELNELAQLGEPEALEQKYGSGATAGNGVRGENRLFTCVNRRGHRLRVEYSSEYKCDQ